MITTNIRVAVSEKPVYDYAVRNYGAEAASAIPQSELLRANGEIHRYLTADSAAPLAIDVRNQEGETVPLFSARETAHMADVRDVVQSLFTAQALAVAAVITLAVVMLMLWPPRALEAVALYGSLLTSGVLGLTALIAISGFDSAWTQFHVIAFNNDLWALNPARDHLIQMFPETFWRDITVLIGAATMLEAVLISGTSVAYLILSRPQEETQAPAEPTPALPHPQIDARPRIAPPNPKHYVH